jgi:hypothetical protein
MNAAVVICDTPVAANVPGFRAGAPTADFPFWGQYYCLDFAVANLAPLADRGLIIVTVEQNREVVQRLLRRHTSVSAKVLTAGSGGGALTATIAASGAEVTIIAATSSVALLDAKQLVRQYQPSAQSLARLTVGRNNLDTYIGATETCLEALHVLANDLSPGESPANGLRDLFAKTLPAAASGQLSVPGRALFGGNVRHLHSEHLWLVDNSESEEFLALCRPLTSVVADGMLADAYIGAGAVVKNSVIGSGCQVDGSVERSFLFPGCSVAAGSRVFNSVIMIGNRIGSGAEVVNSLVFPSDDRQPNAMRVGGGRDTPTIGEKSRVGRLPSNVANVDFPRQIRGLTVIGTNPNIPARMHVQSGCYVGADVPAATLAVNLKLVNGTSVLANGAYRA